ncbi:MAG: SRPBCC family protein [Desulfohalobiaceae bacterium]
MFKIKIYFKKIKIGVLVFLLVLTGLILINSMLELGKINKSIVIDASPKEVFSFTGDWKNLPEYQKGIENWQPTTENTRGEGAKFSYTTNELGIEFDIETKIVDVTLNEERVWRTVSGADIEAKYLFEPQNGRTKTTYILDYNLPIPIIGNILDVLLVRESRELWVENTLQNLKKLIEE